MISPPAATTRAAPSSAYPSARPAQAPRPLRRVGGPALAEDWGSLSGANVIALVDPTSDDAMPILKALAKALLRSNIAAPRLRRVLT